VSVAESYGQCITAFDITSEGGLAAGRPWAATPGHHPDGICLAPDETLWYADVSTGQCVNIGAGREIRDAVQLDRAAFACTIGDGVLYVTTNTGGPDFDPSAGRGQLVAIDV
jgi:sugar lactone lactonase YvrE